MRLSLKQHKVPVGVTTIGLLAAVGLASAPAIMAESESEILLAKNSASIETLTETLDGRTTQMQQLLDSQAKNTSAQFSNLENQISTLNKAATLSHRRHKSMQNPSGAIRSSIAALEKNTDARLVILEKAVTRLHKKQSSVPTAELESEEPANSTANTDAAISNANNRIVNLEKAVKNLNLKQIRNQASQESKAISSNDDQPSNRDLAEHSLRIASLEQTIQQIRTDQATQLQEIQLQIDQRQLPLRTAKSSGKTNSNTSVRQNIETEIRIKRLERSLQQLGRRLENIESESGQQQIVVEQLFDLRDTIDILLNEFAE